MKTSEPLDSDKMLQMLVDSKSDMPCIAMHGSRFCEDCKVNLLGYPKKECWLRYIEWKENRVGDGRKQKAATGDHPQVGV